MNVYECNGTNIFMRWKMKCSIQRGEAELNGTFHLSPNENICSIARMRNIHYLFYITCTKRFKFFNKFNKKIWKAARPTVRGKYYADACVTLNARTVPVAFASRRVAHVIFLISLVLEQTSEDCIGNTEHSNINVNDECNSK